MVLYTTLIESTYYNYNYNCNLSYSEACIVQFAGIPEGPSGQDVIEELLTNSPLSATEYSQLSMQLYADISVARHLI
jgi:hypothetical protein